MNALISRRLDILTLSAGMLISWHLISYAAAEELSKSQLTRLKTATVFVKIDEVRKLRGSGFFITNEIVATNIHVLGMSVERPALPKRIELVLMSGQDSETTIDASIVGLDFHNDVAFLRVPHQAHVKPLEVRKSETIIETLPVYILGFPLAEGLDLQSKNPSITVSTGSISSLRRNQFGMIEKLQVNGNINPGNSGGPIVDIDGNLVAVSKAAILGLGIGFSIPGDTIAANMEGRISGAAVTRHEHSNGLFSLNVAIATVDPLKKIQRLTINYWQSSTSSIRPLDPKEKFPTYGAPSDGPKMNVELRFDSTVNQWVGKIQNFRLGPSQELWIQPEMTTKMGVRLVGAVNHSKDTTAKVAEQAVLSNSPSTKRSSNLPNILAPRFTPKHQLSKIQPIVSPLSDALEAEIHTDESGNPSIVAKSVITKYKIGNSEVKQLLADPHGDKVYAILANEPDVLVINPFEPTKVRRISVPKSPVHLWCDAQRLVVACSESRVVLVHSKSPNRYE